MFIYGGFLMVFPGFGGEKSVAALTKGKKVITNTLIGLAIILFAWLGVDAIIKVLVGRQEVGSGQTAEIRGTSGFGPWNKVECQVPPPSSASFTSPGVTGQESQSQQQTPAVIPKTSANIKIGPCQDCVNITQSTGIACKNGCNANSELVKRLATLNEHLKVAGFLNPSRVTEGHPPTVFHNDACHSVGTCVDVAAIGAASPQWIKAFIAAADKSNLRVEYETGNSDIYEGLKKQGIPVATAGQTSGLRFFTGTGDHFSVYMKQKT
jgi:hypothetical protein